MEKSQITADLISLRGGLSLISRFTDGIKKQERIKEQQNTETNLARESLLHVKKNIVTIENSIKQEKSILNNLEISLKNQKYDDYINSIMPQIKAKAKEKFKTEFDFFLWLKAFGISILVHLVLTFLFGSINNVVVLFILSAGPLIIGGVGYPLIAIASILFNLEKRKRFIENEIQRYTREFDFKIEHIESNIESTKRKIITLEHRLVDTLAEKDAREKHLNDKMVLEQNVIVDSNTKIHELSKKAKNVNQALLNTYGESISRSDWQNIDLIIHYIETGRADTLKEALNLVDRQRQTDQIIHAITAANQALANHIDNAFSKLGSALALSFSKLDSSLQTISMQLEKNSETASILSNNIAKKIDIQISEAQMHSALLEKSNQTSEKLIDDLRYNQRYWVK